eukprot:4956081-Pyramimonas_sp.AAC.1
MQNPTGRALALRPLASVVTVGETPQVDNALLVDPHVDLRGEHAQVGCPNQVASKAKQPSPRELRRRRQ